MGAKEVKTFDELFDFLKSLPFPQYLTSSKISVTVVAKYSQLNAEKSIQSVAHKAILQSLWVTHHPEEEKKQEEKSDFEIFLHLENDVLRVYLNTSGNSLHQRGWRKQTGPAPIKENIAAALVLLSGRKFSAPLIDPCCWSGTLLIEAACLAKNRAPWKGRNFAFQKFQLFDPNLRNHLIETATQKEFDKPYTLIWRDLDASVLEMAQKNAKEAWVDSSIQFEQKDLLQSPISFDTPFRTLTNPPYGKRLSQGEDLSPLYHTLMKTIQQSFGGIVSSFPDLWFLFSQYFHKEEYQQKTLYNGADEVKFYRKKFS